MKTDWNYIEQIVDELQIEGKEREAGIVDDLYDEATRLEDDLDGAKEKLQEYEKLFAEAREIVEGMRKSELSDYGHCSAETRRLIIIMHKFNGIKQVAY